MKKLLILFAFLFICGCGSNSIIGEKEELRLSNDVVIVRIDGCQYLKCTIYGYATLSYVYTHKGNCDNPIHRYK